MSEALPIRTTFRSRGVAPLARRESNRRVASRLLALAHALEVLDRGPGG